MKIVAANCKCIFSGSLKGKFVVFSVGYELPRINFTSHISIQTDISTHADHEKKDGYNNDKNINATIILIAIITVAIIAIIINIINA